MNKTQFWMSIVGAVLAASLLTHFLISTPIIRNQVQEEIENAPRDTVWREDTSLVGPLRAELGATKAKLQTVVVERNRFKKLAAVAKVETVYNEPIEVEVATLDTITKDGDYFHTEYYGRPFSVFDNTQIVIGRRPIVLPQPIITQTVFVDVNKTKWWQRPVALVGGAAGMYFIQKKSYLLGTTLFGVGVASVSINF